MKDKKPVLLVIGVLFVVTGVLIGRTQIVNNFLEDKDKEIAKVTKVIDGDTIQVLINDKKETVRLIGIDTPETVDPRSKVECFGKEASQKLKNLLNGKNVVLKNDPKASERDKYGRLLRYVSLEDGTNINKLMIREGYAYEFTYNSNPYNYQIEFKLAEKKAREEKKGLWTDLKPSSCFKE